MVFKIYISDDSRVRHSLGMLKYTFGKMKRSWSFTRTPTKKGGGNYDHISFTVTTEIKKLWYNIYISLINISLIFTYTGVIFLLFVHCLIHRQ